MLVQKYTFKEYIYTWKYNVHIYNAICAHTVTFKYNSESNPNIVSFFLELLQYLFLLTHLTYIFVIREIDKLFLFIFSVQLINQIIFAILFKIVF